MWDIIAQIIGFIAVGTSFFLYQVKTKKSILIIQTVICITFTVHYLMLKAYPAMVLNCFGVVRNLIYYFDKTFKGKAWPYITSLIMLGLGLLSWTDAWSLMVIIPLVVYNFCISLKNPQHLRICILFVSPVVLAYNVIVFSLGGVLFEAISIVSAIIGLIRYGKNATERNAVE